MVLIRCWQCLSLFHVEKGTLTFSENIRTVVFEVRLNVLLEVVLWAVCIRRWCYEAGYSEPIFGLAKRISGLILESRDALVFACEAQISEVAGWCGHLFLLF